jgi:hypothetical protein
MGKYIQRLLRNLLGICECDECGVLAVGWGREVVKNAEETEFGYYCERCSNPGFVLQQHEDAVKKFEREATP